MRLALFTLIVTAGFSAHAQWGLGLSEASRCQQAFSPSPSAIDSDDILLNQNGLSATARSQIVKMKNQLRVINADINLAKGEMGHVLSAGEIRAIDEHRTYNRNKSDYQTGCGHTAPKRSSAGVLDELAGNVPAATADTEKVPSPIEFCPPYKNSRLNLWVRFSLDGGQVSDSVCDYSSNFSGHTDAVRAAACKKGLQRYYEFTDKKTALQSKISELEMGSGSEEGGLCPTCPGGVRSGSNNALVGNSIAPIITVVAAAAFKSLLAPRNPPPMMYPMNMGPYPANPYVARIPHYYNVGPNGYYGEVPGAIGPGTFGCQGANPAGLGNSFGVQPPAFLNANGFNPLANQFMTPIMNPNLQSSILQPGYGPGFGPVLGNGLLLNQQLGLRTPPTLLPMPTNGAINTFPYLNNTVNGRYPPTVLPLTSNYWNSAAYSQVSWMNQQYQTTILNSPQYGGMPPAILPLSSSPTIYNTPGTVYNPISIMNSTTGAPNIIRTR